ncbi:MAG: glycerol-3-phosphate 1-O-acyltransferase PlsY [Spirulinaceae cyanobacterium RM2_2_10]|nr:glycerol-3-phosphate 1-O-acyltransferase PlsY [Spirulinaceae cyanobacterium SM2_1_0]NJO19044.1 glycerol-3-phosphate 1-O-acyltransferase PlsY [Spirulinaceae cyanobacterium RM2_2_10]
MMLFAPLLTAILLASAAYLCGSLPTGYLVARQLKGIDIREHGSGSTGATNVLRTVGKSAALVVLLVDIVKGALPIYLVRLTSMSVPELLPAASYDWLVAVAALMAAIGHSRSVWLGFKGGKSVATSLGILLAMMPWAALGTLLVFSVVLAISRIVSLSSISGAIAVSVFAIACGYPLPYCLFALVAGSYVITRHRSNIQRLLAGTEPALGKKLQSNAE